MKYYIVFLFSLCFLPTLTAQTVEIIDEQAKEAQQPTDTLSVQYVEDAPEVLVIDYTFIPRKRLGGIIIQNRKNKVTLNVQLQYPDFSYRRFEVRVKTKKPYVLDLSDYLYAGESATVWIRADGFVPVMCTASKSKSKV